jgi:hypothetical protein
MSNLHLNLHHRWFAAIAAGTKTTEYRDATPYWERWLSGKTYDTITFSNGYSPEAPRMVVECRGISRAGDQFHIHLGRILSIHRWPPQTPGSAP